MKQKTANVISKVVFLIAQRSANATCDWITFQPKVPEKLRNNK